jgi:hypothetical protein
VSNIIVEHTWTLDSTSFSKVALFSSTVSMVDGLVCRHLSRLSCLRFDVFSSSRRTSASFKYEQPLRSTIYYHHAVVSATNCNCLQPIESDTNTHTHTHTHTHTCKCFQAKCLNSRSDRNALDRPLARMLGERVKACHSDGVSDRLYIRRDTHARRHTFSSGRYDMICTTNSTGRSSNSITARWCLH